MAEVEQIETRTETITHKVITVKALKCDVCGKEFKGKHWELTTGHYDWGNDSCESIEHYDLCSEDCIRNKIKDYFEDCDDYCTHYFNLEQSFFKEYRRGK